MTKHKGSMSGFGERLNSFHIRGIQAVHYGESYPLHCPAREAGDRYHSELLACLAAEH
jgi:hypothetical protein